MTLSFPNINPIIFSFDFFGFELSLRYYSLSYIVGIIIAWRIILPQLPGFLYFREEASPHLLPILFEVNSLKKQLRLRVKELEIQKEVNSTESNT